MLRYLLSKCWLVAFSVETYLSRRFTDVWRRVTDVMEACVGCEGSPKWCIFYFIGCKDNRFFAFTQENSQTQDFKFSEAFSCFVNILHRFLTL